MKIRITELRQRADWHEKMAKGRISGDGFWLIVPDALIAISPLSPAANDGKARHRPNGAQAFGLTAIPEHLWPIWALAIRKLRRAGERGVGDMAERQFGGFGGTAFKAAFKALAARDCSCDARRDKWNVLYPYGGV